MELTDIEKFFFVWIDHIDSPISWDAHDHFWKNFAQKFGIDKTIEVQNKAYGYSSIRKEIIEELLNR